MYNTEGNLTDALRILILVPDLPDPLEHITGGVQSAVLNLLRGFEHFHVDVMVLSITDDTTEVYTKKMLWNVRITYVPEGPSRLSSVNYVLHASRYVRDFVSTFDPHVVHFEEGMNFLLLRLFVHKRWKHVLTVHGITFAEARIKRNLFQKLKWYQNGIVEWLLLPRNIIHISEYSKRVISGGQENGFPVIFNAVTPDFFSIENYRGQGNQLVYVGVINIRKNIKLLLKALYKLKAAGKRYHLKVVGDYDRTEKYRGEIEAYIRKRGLADQVEFLGWCTQTELLQIYTDADIVVLPSRQETLPVVIAETMAAGRVMVASDVGGIPEMISHGESGYVFPSNDLEALYRILATLHMDREKIGEVGNAARVAARYKFHCKVIAARTISYYEKISKKN